MLEISARPIPFSRREFTHATIFSSGSACSSNSSHTSSALTAYGRTEREADSSIRISLSKRNTKEELDALIEGLASGIARLAKIR